MIKKQIVCDGIDPVGPYSVAMQVGPAVLVSGQLPIDKEGKLVSEDIVEQTRHVIKQIENILKSVDMTLDNVVKTTVFLIDLDEFKEVNRAYAIYFGHPYPVRSCVEVSKLPQNARIKIECVAVDAQMEKEEDCAGCCCD